MIFVDTGVWFARFVRDDIDHKRVSEWFRSNRLDLVTTDYCVDETLTPMQSRRYPQTALAAGACLLDESMARLHHVTVSQFQRSWTLFQQRINQDRSFTDCTSKVVIDDLGITAALSLDRHFEAFGVSVLP